MRPLLVVLALGAVVPATEKTASQPAVRAGVDVLAGEEFARLKGRHVGLVTNHTGRAAPDGTRRIR
jgi:uncharacterized protein YbbC (DUF1343 family)